LGWLRLLQKREIEIEGATGPQFFYGGATLIVDLTTSKIQYSIGKRLRLGTFVFVASDCSEL
jgi:hypothetical protein